MDYSSFNKRKQIRICKKEISQEYRQLRADNFGQNVEDCNNFSSPSFHNVSVEFEQDSSMSSSSDHSQYDFSDEEEYLSSSDSEYVHSDDEQFLCQKIRQWALTYHISLVALTALLKLLCVYFSFLPKDGRTLLKTPRKTVTKKIENGELCYFGISEGLCKNLTPDIESPIVVNFNIDGIPLHKSNKQQFWPILGCTKFNKIPFIVAVFLGNSKPKCLKSYLSEFILEVTELLKHGLILFNKHYEFKIGCFICDAPARAFLKCIKSHNAYSACEKCNTSGTYTNNKVCFPIEGQLRDDISFKQKLDEDHHISVSPLEELPIGMISQFPLDYMHLVCLGVTRRLLLTWIKGPLKTRLGSTTILTLSSSLLSLKKHMPVEFNRKPRSLLEIKWWKATELRTFLLYTGPFVLNNSVPKPVFDNFMMLSFAIKILISKFYHKAMCNIAGQILALFVRHCSKLYGNSFIVYNVHSLYHLHRDVEIFGPLDEFSAWPFENFLGQLKGLLRSSKHPLQELHRRVTELKSCQRNQSSELFELGNKDPQCTSNTCTKYFRLKYNNYSFDSKKIADCYCMLTDKTVVKIDYIFQNSESVCIVGRNFISCTNFFNYPQPSALIDIFEVWELNIKQNHWPLEQIMTKCIVFPYKDRFISFPFE